MPKRVQMRRDRPWRKNYPDAVIVARPTKWGNPAVMRSEKDRLDAIAWFEMHVAPKLPSSAIFEPCHACFDQFFWSSEIHGYVLGPDSVDVCKNVSVGIERRHHSSSILSIFAATGRKDTATTHGFSLQP